MKLVLHKNFANGQYTAVASELLDEKKPSVTKIRKHLASLVGALSFLGRMEEARDIFELHVKKAPTRVDILAARFFLAIGWTRISEYNEARRLLSINEKEAGKSAIEQFFVFQGRAFYNFYIGAFSQSLEDAMQAKLVALASGNLFARALAIDSLGHCYLKAGEIHTGIRFLEEAKILAKKAGDEGFVSASEIAIDIYKLEYGVEAEATLKRLSNRLEKLGTEDNYSFADIGLELSREYTLRGKYKSAADILERIAPVVYANRNRRQEIMLNLRLAELAGRRGRFFETKHYLWFSKRLLHGEVDASYELMALGIERKIVLSEGRTEALPALDARWDELSQKVVSTRDANLRKRISRPSTMNENPSDLVHLALTHSHEGKTLEEKLQPLLVRNLLAEIALLLKFNPAEPTLAVLPKQLGLIWQSREEICFLGTKLSSQQMKILRSLKGGEQSKSSLVQNAWGYRYDPLRHDSMVYAAMSAVRKSLREAGESVLVTESGYRFDGKITFYAELEEEETSPVADPSTFAENLSWLNHRQVEILDWLRSKKYLTVRDCQKRFNVSEVTALRDLDALRRHDLVLRLGKARATRYALRS